MFLAPMSPQGEGASRPKDGQGSAAQFLERCIFLIARVCLHSRFFDEFLRKTTNIQLFFADFRQIDPCLRKICQEMDPCLESFGPKKHPYELHIPVHRAYIMYPLEACSS